MKKLNPRRRPVNQADLLRAKNDAVNEAANSALVIFFTVLCDKFGADADQLKQLYAEMNKLSEGITDGYVSISD